MTLKGLKPSDIGAEVRLGYVGKENIRVKGRRLLIEGRLLVVHIDQERIIAFCRGSELIHKCGFERGSYFCSCPAKSLCSHLVALQLVTRRPDGAATPPGGWAP